MSSLLEDYGIDTSDIEVPSFEIADDIYEFVIGDVFIQHGTKADPDGGDSLVISYQLGDEGKEKREYFNMPEDPEDVTPDERKKLGWYVSRMLDLGFDRSEINSIQREDLIGLTGTLQVYSQKGKGANSGKTYQNIKNVRVAERAADEEPAPKQVAKTKAPAKPKAASTPKTAAANPFAK